MSIPTGIVVKVNSVNDLLPPVMKVQETFYKVQHTTTVSQES
jgi:hypothetical protein